VLEGQQRPLARLSPGPTQTGNLGGTILKIKKTVSDKVIAANRSNSQHSTGPRSVSGKHAASRNAIKHGLLAKRLVFRDKIEEMEFNAFADNLQLDSQPEGALEHIMAEDICTTWWTRAQTQGWELHEIQDRRRAAEAILRAVAQNYNQEQLSLFTTADGTHSAAGLGWDCQELVIRTATTNSEQEEERARENSDKTGQTDHVQIVAKLNTSMENLLRYETHLRRGLYGAIATFRDLQRERRARRKPRAHGIDASTEAD
jgi:hypothetical protein